MIILTATMRAKLGCEALLENVLKTMMPQVATEAGTLEYTLHQSKNDNCVFFFYEKYADQAALDHHLSTPCFKEMMSKISAYISEDPIVELFEQCAAKN